MIPPLYNAAKNGEIDILCEYRNQIHDQLTGNNNTVLHVVAQFNQFSCVEQILTVCGPSLLHRTNCEGDTPLHIAARGGNFPTAEALVDQAGNLGMLRRKELLRATNLDEDTALHIAVLNGHLEMVRFLTSADREFSHAANKAKETPLYLAVKIGDSDMVKAIVDNCTWPAYSGPDGRTALHEAARMERMPEITSILLRWMSKLNDKKDDHGWTALHYAADGCNVSAVKELLMVNYSLGHIKAGKKDDEKTAIHMAAAEGHVEVMKEILSACPDSWDIFDRKRHNVLHVAAKMEKEDVIEFIFQCLPFDQLLYQKDNEGNMPLHLLAASKLKDNEGNMQSSPSRERRAPFVDWREIVNNNIRRLGEKRKVQEISP